MPKRDNKDDLDGRITRLEIESGIDKGIHKWIRTVCITSTSTFAGFCIWLGGQIYDKYDAIGAAVKAFLAAGKPGS